MHEVWITGIGLITALGNRDRTWQRLLAGESGIREVTVFDTTGYRTHIAGEVPSDAVSAPATFAPAMRQASRASRLALAATACALDDARLQPTAGDAWGIAFNGGAAGLLEAEAFARRRFERGRRARGLTELLEVPQDSPSDRVALALGLTGPRITITTACSSSSIAVGRAAEMVRDGEAEVALAGGADALCRLTYAGFNSLRAVSAERARPFDRNRAGLNLGEGAAVLVLESAARASRRGARPYAAVLGYGMTNDAFHMTQPEPSGSAWERTIRAALTDAGLDGADVDYVNAHGTATVQNDPAESAAYGRVFGDRLARLPISSVKGAVGHCLCAAGGIEAAVTALAVRDAVAPPTAGFAEADPTCPVDPVPGTGRPLDIRVALTSSFAFGGNSAVLALGRPS